MYSHTDLTNRDAIPCERALVETPTGEIIASSVS